MTELYSRPALVLSDDNILDKQISKTLSTLQYRVDNAKTISEALQYIEKQNYLLIIVTDQPNRNIDALEFHNKLSTTDPKLIKKVIYFSDKKSTELNARLKQLDCSHLDRPFEPAQLAFEIEDMRSRGLLNETRIENRYNWTGECKIDSNGEYTGKTMDISANGIKLYYNGDKIDKNSEAIIHIPDIGYDGKARVRWNFTMGEKNMMGLDLLTNIKSDDLQKAIPW